jgi:hypothetical protein
MLMVSRYSHLGTAARREALEQELERSDDSRAQIRKLLRPIPLTEVDFHKDGQLGILHCGRRHNRGMKTVGSGNTLVVS